MSLALSFVIPLYRSAETIAAVVHDIEALTIEGGHEIILVNDGSEDRTVDEDPAHEPFRVVTEGSTATWLGPPGSACTASTGRSFCTPC